MNRISRRSEAEAAEALLEAGRTQPALQYDVELGLARHQHWLRSEAPMPEWANASAGIATKSLVSVVIKTVFSAVLMGALAVAAWHARGRPQPPAADVEQPSPSPELIAAAAPSVPDVTVPETWMATIPMPVSDQDLPSDQPARRTVRAEPPGKRAARLQRAHKELAPARAEAAAPATTEPSQDVNAERAPRGEVAAATEREPTSAAHRARPEPAAQAEAPDDLVEMQQVATAEQLLARSPERALALVRQGDQRFAHGYFQQERAYIAIMALIRLGRIDAARARAASFAKRFPALPYGARIRSALEKHQGSAVTRHERDETAPE